VETSSLVDNGDGSFVVVPSYTSKCAGGAGAGGDYLASAVLTGSSLENTLPCNVKCQAGCDGDSCQCDHYRYDHADAAYQMCGTLQMMKDAVATINQEAISSVVGFDYNAATSIGYLAVAKTSAGDVECANLLDSASGVHQSELVEDEFSTHYDVQFGKHCTGWSDFSEAVGTVTVTNRAYVGVDVVMTPDATLEASIEVYQPSTVSDVTGNNIGDIGETSYIGLTEDAAGNSADRVMVIDCGGTCGRTDPSAHVTIGGTSFVSDWIDQHPVHWFEDATAASAASATGPLKLNPASIVSYPYEEHTGQFCDSNMDADISIPIAGVSTNILAEFGCWNTCHGECNRIHGPCDCSGWLGSEDQDSTALCMSKDDAQMVCDAIGSSCTGFKIMATLDRVYLNDADTDSCTWETNAAYNSFVKDPTHESLAENNVGCPLTQYVGHIDRVEIAAGADFAAVDHLVTFHNCNTQVTDFTHNNGVYTFGDSYRITTITIPAMSADTDITATVSGPSQSELTTTKAAHAAGGAAVLQPRHTNNILRHPFDIGASWEETLRFRGLTFGQGGTFKLCFCDSERLSDGICGHKSDFVVDLGKVHVSGVSCLLGESRFQRSNCRSHFWGQGLTCTDATVSLNIPTINDEILESTSTYTAEVTNTLSTFCLYGPEEDTYGFNWCQIVADFQSIAENAA